MITIATREETLLETIAILKWSREQYCLFQYEEGLEYLRRFLPNDEEGRSLLECEKLFWSWWRLRWHNRDVSFVESAAYCPRSLALELYYHLHDSSTLISEIRPPSLITKKAFA